MTTRLRLAWEKVKALLFARSLDREFDEELASHVELATDDARRRGLDPEQAKREALRWLGGVQRTRELHRETRGVPLVDGITQDVAYGFGRCGARRSSRSSSWRR
jgi:hypothetical protein